MLTHPTLDQLTQLGLLGMANAFGEIAIDADAANLTHAEWLALLLEREISYRHDKRLAARLRYAKLRHHAAVEDVDYRAVRGLDRGLFQKLSAGAWIDAHDNLILCGPTGVGKSWLASAARWVGRANATGSPAALPMGGKKPFTLAEEAGWIRARLAEKPDITGRKLLAELHERKVDVSYYGVWHFLDHAGLSFKKRACMPVSKTAMM
jgi:transposase